MGPMKISGYVLSATGFFDFAKREQHKIDCPLMDPWQKKLRHNSVLSQQWESFQEDYADSELSLSVCQEPYLHSPSHQNYEEQQTLMNVGSDFWTQCYIPRTTPRFNYKHIIYNSLMTYLSYNNTLLRPYAYYSNSTLSYGFEFDRNIPIGKIEDFFMEKYHDWKQLDCISKHYSGAEAQTNYKQRKNSCLKMIRKYFHQIDWWTYSTGSIKFFNPDEIGVYHVVERLKMIKRRN